MPQLSSKPFTLNSGTGSGSLANIPIEKGDWVGFQLTLGTLSATVTFEATIDGTTFFPLAVTPVGGGAAVTTAAAAGAWFAQCPWAKQVQARVSAFTSGSGTMVVAQAADFR